MFATGYDLNKASVSGGSGFFNPSKIADGATVSIRCMGAALTGYVYWTNNGKPKRVEVMPEGTPPDIRKDEDGNPERIRHFWAFPVWNATEGQIQIAEVTQKGIQDALWNFYNDPDWGDLTKYNVKIKREGKSLETKYHVSPTPAKDLPESALEEWSSKSINLRALLDGGNPFEGGSNDSTAAPPSTPTAPDKSKLIAALFASAKGATVEALTPEFNKKGITPGPLDSKEALKAFMGVESIKEQPAETLKQWVDYFNSLASYDEIPF